MPERSPHGRARKSRGLQGSKTRCFMTGHPRCGRYNRAGLVPRFEPSTNEPTKGDSMFSRIFLMTALLGATCWIGTDTADAGWGLHRRYSRVYHSHRPVVYHSHYHRVHRPVVYHSHRPVVGYYHRPSIVVPTYRTYRPVVVPSVSISIGRPVVYSHYDYYYGW